MTYIKTRSRLIEVIDEYKYVLQEVHNATYLGFVELTALTPDMDMFPTMDGPLKAYSITLNISHIEEIYPIPS